MLSYIAGIPLYFKQFEDASAKSFHCPKCLIENVDGEAIKETTLICVAILPIYVRQRSYLGCISCGKRTPVRLGYRKVLEAEPGELVDHYGQHDDLGCLYGVIPGILLGWVPIVGLVFSVPGFIVACLGNTPRWIRLCGIAGLLLSLASTGYLVYQLNFVDHYDRKPIPQMPKVGKVNPANGRIIDAK